MTTVNLFQRTEETSGGDDTEFVLVPVEAGGTSLLGGRGKGRGGGDNGCGNDGLHGCNRSDQSVRLITFQLTKIQFLLC